MTVKLIAYGIAKDILHGREKEFPLSEGASIADLKAKLMNEYPQFTKLSSLSFAVEEEYRADSYLLEANSEVVLIPPVSGG